MVVDLKKIFVSDNSSLPIEAELDMSSLSYYGQFPLKSPVKLTGRVLSRASIVGLDAEITYEFDSPCDRCGVEFVSPVTVRLDKVLAVSAEGEDNEDIILVPDMTLDLDELIYTEVVVSLPTKHLCREECKGICVKCGKNLNQGECGCPKKEIDPRLSALADLIE